MSLRLDEELPTHVLGPQILDIHFSIPGKSDCR